MSLYPFNYHTRKCWKVFSLTKKQFKKTFIKLRNLPYSTEEVKRLSEECNVHPIEKPRIVRGGKLIKTIQPFERLNIDFKGPLSSSRGGNKYLLIIIDEYSRFPFACWDMLTTTVLTYLSKLFCIFGMPSYIYSDEEPSFMSEELRRFFQQKGLATSRSTTYNPWGNGQMERLNRTLLRMMNLALKSRFTCAFTCFIWCSPLNSFQTVYNHKLYSLWMDVFLSEKIYLWKICSCGVDDSWKSAYEKQCSEQEVRAYCTRSWADSGKSRLHSC